MRHKLVHLTLKKKSKLTEEVSADPGCLRGPLGREQEPMLPVLRALGRQATGQRRGDRGDGKRAVRSGGGQVGEGFPDEGT